MDTNRSLLRRHLTLQVISPGMMSIQWKRKEMVMVLVMSPRKNKVRKRMKTYPSGKYTMCFVSKSVRCLTLPSKIPCDFPKCPSTFGRVADRDRHMRTVHSKSKPYPCDVRNCTRGGNNGFSRKDHLWEHKRNYHHVEIPKRRYGGAKE